MCPESGPQLACACVPQLNLPVRTSGSQQLAIWAECDRPDILAVFPRPEGRFLLPTGQVPELDAATASTEAHHVRGPSCGQTPPIRTEGDSIGTPPRADLPLED